MCRRIWAPDQWSTITKKLLVCLFENELRRHTVPEIRWRYFSSLAQWLFHTFFGQMTKTSRFLFRTNTFSSWFIPTRRWRIELNSLSNVQRWKVTHLNQILVSSFQICGNGNIFKCEDASLRVMIPPLHPAAVRRALEIRHQNAKNGGLTGAATVGQWRTYAETRSDWISQVQRRAGWVQWWWNCFFNAADACEAWPPDDVDKMGLLVSKPCCSCSTGS